MLDPIKALDARIAKDDFAADAATIINPKVAAAYRDVQAIEAWEQAVTLAASEKARVEAKQKREAEGVTQGQPRGRGRSR